jgi:hypothetical protein
MALDFASLSETGITSAIGPSTSEATVKLLELLQVIVLAMFLQLLISVKALTTNGVSVVYNPATEKMILLSHNM